MEVMELAGHPYYCAVQYHPEYISRPLAPSPPYLGLVLASVGKLQSFLAHGFQASTPTRGSSDAEESEDEISSMVKNLSYHEPARGVVLPSGHSGSSLDSQEHGLVFQAGPGGDGGKQGI
jgi:CTP synthase